MKLNPSPKTITGKGLVIENTKETYVVPLASTSTYVWRVVGGTIDGDSTSNIVRIDWGGANPNASVTLVETDQKNCVRDNVLPVNVASIIGINERGNEFGLGSIYPNPSSTLVNIPVVTKGEWMVDIRLYDLTGKLIKSVYNGSINGSTQIQMSVDNLHSGMYYLEMTTNDGHKSTQKLTVE